MASHTWNTRWRWSVCGWVVVREDDRGEGVGCRRRTFTLAISSIYLPVSPLQFTFTCSPWSPLSPFHFFLFHLFNLSPVDLFILSTHHLFTLDLLTWASYLGPTFHLPFSPSLDLRLCPMTFDPLTLGPLALIKHF